MTKKALALLCGMTVSAALCVRADPQSTVVSDEFEESNTDMLSMDVSGVRLGASLKEVQALNTNAVISSEETHRKDIETQVQDYATLEASELLHGSGHAWPGWSTVRVWFTRPEIGNKAFYISFGKELGALPDMKALEGRLVKKYGAWCRKCVTKQDNGSFTYRFFWGAYDKQQGRFLNTAPCLQVWVGPARVEKGEPVYKISFDLTDPRLKIDNQAAVEKAVDEMKVKAAQAIPF